MHKMSRDLISSEFPVNHYRKLMKEYSFDDDLRVPLAVERRQIDPVAEDSKKPVPGC